MHTLTHTHAPHQITIGSKFGIVSFTFKHKIAPKCTIENAFSVQWLMVMIRMKRKCLCRVEVHANAVVQPSIGQCTFDLHIFDLLSMIIIISRYIIMHGDNLSHADWPWPIDLMAHYGWMHWDCVRAWVWTWRLVYIDMCVHFKCRRNLQTCLPITFPIWRTCSHCTNWSPDSNINYKCK